MTTPKPTVADDLDGIIDDSSAATRTDPLEEHFVLIGDTVIYTGPGRVQAPWSAVEFHARRTYGLEKDRTEYDAIDPHDPLYTDTTDIECKGVRALPDGRVALRDRQHRHLLNEDRGEYIISVYQPLTDRAIHIVDHARLPAETVDAKLSDQQWSPRDSARLQENEVRLKYQSFDVFDEKRIKREAYLMDHITA